MNLGDRIRTGFSNDLEQEVARKIVSVLDKWRKGGRLAIARKRWLFELIQNPIDVARETKKEDLRIEIEADRVKMTFRHDAGFFNPREIRALVFAYSTKPYERESE